MSEKTANDHALRVVDTVLKFFDIARLNSLIEYNTPTLMMKAGINTGPAVAGVIGSKKCDDAAFPSTPNVTGAGIAA
eukprot:gene15476-15479_t